MLARWKKFVPRVQRKSHICCLPGDDASSDDEPDELVPIDIKLGKTKEVKGKDDKAKKKSAVDDAKAKKAPISAAAKVQFTCTNSFWSTVDKRNFLKVFQYCFLQYG